MFHYSAQGAGKAENIYGTTGSSSYNASGNQGQTGNNVTGLNDTTLNSYVIYFFLTGGRSLCES